MGFELILAGVSAVAGIAGTFMKVNAASQAAAQQREANRIQSNQQQIESAESRRQRVREERIRRARIQATSVNSGVSGSSGELGALGALNTNLGSLFSQASGRALAAEGINTANQNAADWLQAGNTIGAWTNTIQSTIGSFSNTVFDNNN